MGLLSYLAARKQADRDEEYRNSQIAAENSRLQFERENAEAQRTHYKDLENVRFKNALEQARQMQLLSREKEAELNYNRGRAYDVMEQSGLLSQESRALDAFNPLSGIISPGPSASRGLNFDQLDYNTPDPRSRSTNIGAVLAQLLGEQKPLLPGLSQSMAEHVGGNVAADESAFAQQTNRLTAPTRQASAQNAADLGLITSQQNIGIAQDPYVQEGRRRAAMGGTAVGAGDAFFTPQDTLTGSQIMQSEEPIMYQPDPNQPPIPIGSKTVRSITPPSSRPSPMAVKKALEEARMKAAASQTDNSAGGAFPSQGPQPGLNGVTPPSLVTEPTPKTPPARLRSTNEPREEDPIFPNRAKRITPRTGTNVFPGESLFSAPTSAILPNLQGPEPEFKKQEISEAAAQAEFIRTLEENIIEAEKQFGKNSEYVQGLMKTLEELKKKSVEKNPTR